MKSLNYYVRLLNKNLGPSKVKYAIENDAKITICEYATSTILALIIAIFIVGGVVFVSFCVAYSLVSIAAATIGGATGIMYDWVDYNLVISIYIIAFACAILAFFVAVSDCIKGQRKVWPEWLPIGNMYRKYISKNKSEVSTIKETHGPSLISMWYESFKSKTCFQIDFKTHGKE